MLSAFLLSLGQLGDRKIIGVFLKSLAVTVLLIALFGAGLWYGAQQAVAALGWSPSLAGLVGTIALLIAFALAWLLFRAVAVAVMGVFADEVVIAVERKHYPAALASARDVSLARGIALGLRSAGRAILVNLALAPVYIMLLVTGVGTALLFFLVNGWLLGNDFGAMVAARHMDDAMMRDWRKTGAVDRFALGVAGTALFMVPILNLFAPIIGAAMATHLFHKGRTA
ncbi:EI24 domain-containing protein [Sphingomonas psychrolutea]|uniref:Cysteine biosynthesis protein n=1 Tax=Sphingomonas psychrolutea TaxID=1259676 RepID=A0ABQ1G354_9SPHN|nr:EI24 domain-containing protein [Sphingomonas psychrolutea]GGA35722.1 cysteine biosynthesis protein [Sphingomonas psychrolutea]